MTTCIGIVRVVSGVLGTRNCGLCDIFSMVPSPKAQCQIQIHICIHNELEGEFQILCVT